MIAPNGTSLILIPPYASSRHDWLEKAAGGRSIIGSVVSTALNSPTMQSAVPTPGDGGAGFGLQGMGFDFGAGGLDFGMGLNVNVNIGGNGGVKGLFEGDSDTDNAVTSPTAVTGTANGDANGVPTPGPAPAAVVNFNGDASLDLDGDEDMEDCDDDSEALLNVDDFIDFGESSSDEDAGHDHGHGHDHSRHAAELEYGEADGEEKEDFYDSDVFGTPATAQRSNLHGHIAESTPSRPSNALTTTNATNADGDGDNNATTTTTDNNNNSSRNNSTVILDAERLLNRLDGGVVTAFRQNHNRYHALIRLPPHKEFLPANSPSRSSSNVSSVFRRTKFSERQSKSSRRQRGPPASYTPSHHHSHHSHHHHAGIGMGMNFNMGSSAAGGMERKRPASSMGYSGSEAVRRKLLDSSSSRRGSAVAGGTGSASASASVVGGDGGGAVEGNGGQNVPSTPVTPAASVKTR